MLFTNPRATRTPYPEALRAVLCLARTQENRRWLAGWRGLARTATPLVALPDLAHRLGVAQVSVKDESVRSPLASFMALGAPIALVRQLLRLHPGLDPAAVLSGRYAAQLQGYTVSAPPTATTGARWPPPRRTPAAPA